MDLVEQPVIDTPAPPVEPPKAPETTSLSEHEALYPGKDSPQASSTTAKAETAIAEKKTATAEESEAEKSRHRAESQKAKAKDVPRIAELTKNWRTAEKERDTLKAQLEALNKKPIDEPKPTAAEPTTTSVTFPKFESWLAKNEGKDYDDYTDARTAWNYTQLKAQDAKAQAETTAKAEQEKGLAVWAERVETARKKYTDFDDVALNGPSKIPPGSALDLFIFDDDAGPDVLYHLHSHPDEVPALLALGPLQQVKALTLLAQRLTTPPRTTAATTGSATAQTQSSAPRPPNPVRTGPLKTGDEPPGDGASLAEHEKFFGRKSR